MDNAFLMDDVPFGTLRSLDDSSFKQCTLRTIHSLTGGGLTLRRVSEGWVTLGRPRAG
jgi:hypothetical protein